YIEHPPDPGVLHEKTLMWELDLDERLKQMNKSRKPTINKLPMSAYIRYAVHVRETISDIEKNYHRTWRHLHDERILPLTLPLDEPLQYYEKLLGRVLKALRG